MYFYHSLKKWMYFSHYLKRNVTMLKIYFKYSILRVEPNNFCTILCFNSNLAGNYVKSKDIVACCRQIFKTEVVDGAQLIESSLSYVAPRASF